MSPTLSIATWNIHKGFSQFNQRMVVHELRERLRDLTPDVLFLQEVQGLHLIHAERHDDWPDAPQHEFLAGEGWHHAYGCNVVYGAGHHGNAIISRYPIRAIHNQDVTHLPFEHRGLLHCRIDLPRGPIHCVCVHLSLFGRSRLRQVEALANHLEHLLPRETPLIIAGDFNDWRNRSGAVLQRRLGMGEAFGGRGGSPVRSFPAALPVFRLDRIYTRGFRVEQTRVLSGSPWSRISDHAALLAHLRRA